MTDHDCLLAAVLANPDDDTPRLMYADWLTDHGEERRAAFIRGQIESAILNPNSMLRLNCRHWIHTARPRRLPQMITWPVWNHVGEEYTRIQFRNNYGTRVIWKRGFVWGLECGVYTWCQLFHKCRDSHPIQNVRAVRGQERHNSSTINEMGDYEVTWTIEGRALRPLRWLATFEVYWALRTRRGLADTDTDELLRCSLTQTFPGIEFTVIKK